MTVLEEGPVLQATAKTGKQKFHRVELVSDGKRFGVRKAWWQDGSVVQHSVPRWVQGKNAGKKNATTAEQQARLDFDRAIQKRRDKGASEDGSTDHVRTKPMLAEKYQDVVADDGSVAFPVYVQRKYDGNRMLMDNQEAWSRGGKLHDEQCVAHLKFKVGMYTLDGEVMLPGNQPLQRTRSALTRWQPGVSDTLEYHVYDVVMPGKTFAERWLYLQQLFANREVPAHVRLVQTRLVHNWKDLMALHRQFTKQEGFEGSIIRIPSGLYQHDRTRDLLKLKDFQEEEFPIVGVDEGEGNNKGLAILVLGLPNGATFRAVPEGGHDYRATLWRGRVNVIGKHYTVRFQHYSDSGVPTGNTVGVAFREGHE